MTSNHLTEPLAEARTEAVEALFRRSRLRGDEFVLRFAGMPLLMAAVVAGGPGWTSYRVLPGDTLTGIARRHGTDPAALARLNGVVRPDDLEAGARLTVPVPPAPDSHARRRAAATGLHPVEASGTPRLTYRVREGDTVDAIARRSGTSVRAVLAANGLRPSGFIRPGQSLVLPALPRVAAATTVKRRAARPVVHVVRPGDTVSAIAQQFGVDTQEVLWANRMTAGQVLRPGRKLVLPGAKARPRPAASPATTTSVHVVRRGDTVSAIARRYGVAASAVLKLNHLSGHTVIRPGKRLLVPVGSGRARTPRGDVPNTFLGRTYPDAVARAAAANRAALRGRPAPGQARIRDVVRTQARRFGVPPSLALAVGELESGFDQRQVSPANAVGVMQVIPSSGAWAGDLVGRRLDLLDAEDNVTAGVAILAALGASARTTDQALAGYYQGLASVRRHGMFADTRRYVATVHTLAARYR